MLVDCGCLLVGVLDNGVVQRAFMSHPTVQHGCSLIAEYAAPVDRAWLAELQRRDREPLPPAGAQHRTGAKRVVVAQ